MVMGFRDVGVASYGALGRVSPTSIFKQFIFFRLTRELDQV